MAVSAIVGLTTAVGAGLAIGYGFTATMFFTAFAFGAGLSVVSKALMPKMDMGSQMRGTTVTTRDPAGPRKLVYGKARVGGNVVFIHHSGSDNKYLHLVVAFATHEIESYDEIWFNDNKIWTTAGFQDDWGTYVTIDRKFGTADQAASSSLVSSVTAWTNNHKLSGIAYIAFRLEWNQDKFPQGVPNITATIRGRKVYDPRTDTTAYSSNPALCVRDYLTDQKYGLGESANLIDSASLIAAANLCDEQVDVASGGTQDRYQCNGVIDTSNQIKSNIENLLSSMGGRISYSNGKYFVEGSSYKAPTFSFDESNTVSAISIKTKQSRRSLYNGVKGTFISEEKNYKVMDYPAQISSIYASEDGDEVFLDMPLPFVTNNLQAQRIAKVALLKSRQQVVISMTVNLSGLKVKVGDTVNISNERLGYDNKVFEITDYDMVISANGESGVNLTLIETAAAVYDWTTSDEVDFLAGGELDLYDGRTVENVTNLTKTEIGLQGPDGRVLSSVELSWTPPDDAFIEFYKIRYNKTGSTNYFYGETREPRILLSGLDISSNYDFRVQGQNLIGVTSTGASLLDQELNGDQTGPGVPTNTSATGGVDLIAAEWDNPTDIDFKHTEVYVSTGTTIPATPTAKVDGEEYIVSGLEGSETRNFWLKAVDFSGNKSAATAMFSGTSTVAPPAEILDGAISTEKIDDDAVTVQKIAEVLQSTNYNEGTAGWKITKAGNVEFNNGAFRGTVTVGNTNLTEANTINANTTASDVGLGNVPNIDTSAAVALTTIRYGEGLMNIVLYKDQLDGGGANPGEIRLTAGKFVAGSISRTLENDVNTVTPWEGAITPPYAGDHFYVIWGSGTAWASDGSARFTTQDAATLTCSANSQGIFVAIYDPINDQWKAVDNANATVNFTPLDTDFAIAIGTKKSLTGGIDSLVTLVPFVNDPDADQTVATIEAGTTITSGGITLSEGGSIKGGQTAYSTGTGFFLGYESAKYQFSVGSTANYLNWDGSSLSVKGTITVGNTNLTESNTLNANTTASDVGLGSVQNLNAQGQTQSGLISGTTITGGGIVINGGGSIKGGQTEYNDSENPGFFLGYDTNAYKFSVGDGDGNSLAFDGTTLTVKGAITVSSGSIANDVTVGGTAASTVASVANQTSLLPRADDSEWTIGTVTSANGIWTGNGQAGENEILLAEGPHGDIVKVWRATSTDGSDADGGFQNISVGSRFTIDEDAVYRLSVFIKQDNDNGDMYLGAYNYNDQNTNIALLRFDGTGATTNKYWFANDLPTQGEWYLVVGYINPHDSNINGRKGGIYNVATGQKVTTFDDWRFNSAAVEFTFRTYQFYAQPSPTAIADWAHPRVDRMDRRAPSIAELLRGWTDIATPIEQGVTITSGGITLSSGGSIKGGQTDYATGTGFFLGYHQNKYRFSVGSTTNYLTWDGANLAVKGTLTVGSTNLTESNTLNSNQSASDITTGTLDASVVTVENLSADNITVGTLNADRINVDGSTISRSGGNLIIPTGGVDTTQIANGAVNNSKIANASIEIGKFAAGITPVRIVSSLPTTDVVEGDTAYLTTDSKLYRYDGENWIKTVDGADIIANSITAGQIAAGAISTSELAANSVTTNKLAVTGRGAALNSDPNIQDSTAWVKFSGANAVFTTITDGDVGNNVIRSGGTPWSWYNGAERLALDPSKTYRMTALARKSSNADGRLFVGVAAFDANGANISGDGTQWSYGAASNVTGSTTFTRYSMEFGAGTNRPLPANGVTFAPLLILNYQSTTGYFEAQDIRIEEKIPAELVVDGAITTDKLASNSIDASKIQAGSITADKIAANSITASRLAIEDISVLNGNPSFELGSDGWDLDGGAFAIVQNNANSGSFSAQKTIAGSHFLTSTFDIPVKGGETFYAEAYIKYSTGASVSTAAVAIRAKSNGANIGGVTGNSILYFSTYYEKSYCSYVVPSNATHINVEVLVTITNATNTTVYIDDVRLFRSSNSVLIADGAITANKIQASSITVDKLSGDVSESFSFGLYKASSTVLSSSMTTFGEFTTPAPDASIKKSAVLHAAFGINANSPSGNFTVGVTVERKSKGVTSGVSLGTVVANGSIAFGARYVEISGNLLTEIDMYGGIATSQTSPSTVYNVVSIEYQSSTSRTRIVYAGNDTISSGTIYYNPDKWTSSGTWLTYAPLSVPRYPIIGVTALTNHILFQPLASSNAEETYRIRAQTFLLTSGSASMTVGIAGKIHLLR